MTNFYQRLSEIIDQQYLQKVKATTIPGSTEKILLICFHPYQNKKLVRLGDNLIIEPNELVGEFHLSNRRILELAADKSERSIEWRILQLLKKDFTCLANACRNGEISDSIKGFYGVLVLVAGAKRLGFILIPLPKGLRRWWIGLWESMLRRVNYSYQTKKKPKQMTPYEVWISREELLRRY